MATKEINVRQTLSAGSEETVYFDIIFLNMYKPIRGTLMTNKFVIYYSSEKAV